MTSTNLTRPERKAIDARLSHRVDETTHHFPGCCERWDECSCFRVDPDLSEFGLAMREGDRAIAAMVADTSTPADIHIETGNVIIDVYTTHAVQIRPGFTIMRPLHLIRACSSTPQITTNTNQGA